MQKTNWLALVILVVGGVVGCNSGGGITSSSWVNPNPNPVESPIVPPAVSQWTTMVGESYFLSGDAPEDYFTYDSKNNVILGSYFNDIAEYYLNQGYNSSWQYGIATTLLHWQLASTSRVTTDNNGMFYFFASGSGLLQPIPRYLISFNDKTLNLHYQELMGNYPADLDFSNAYYYNGSVYAVESAPGTNNAYSYNLVSFSVESGNFGTYESTLNNVYSSNSLWLTSDSYNYMLNSRNNGYFLRTSLISAVLGDNGNIYINDHGQVVEIPLNNPAGIRKIGVQLGDNYAQFRYVSGEPYLSPIAYNNGKIYSCGQVGSNPFVNVIVALPIVASPEQQWESIGYTWHFNDSLMGNFYEGCYDITSNGSKIFVKGGYEVNTQFGIRGGAAIYESDISTTFNQQGQ